MIFNLNTHLPIFGVKLQERFVLAEMSSIFMTTLSGEEKSRFNLYLSDLLCSDGCGAKMDIAYHGFHDHVHDKAKDNDIVFSPEYKHRKGERADNICVSVDSKSIKSFQDFLWSVEKAQKFKADFISDMWAVLELHGDLGYLGFKIMVRGEVGKTKLYLYETHKKLPIVPLIKVAENARECLGLILELDGDPDSFEQGDKNFAKNPMTASIMKWAKEYFTLNGLGDKDIHFSWTRKYKYLVREDEPLPF